MNTKLTSIAVVVLLAGCSNINTKTTKKTNLKDSAVKTLLDGTWIVRQTDNTPIRSDLMKDKYFQYYSGLHANSIGCKSYSQVSMKIAKNEKAYKCVANGTYLTKDSLAIGTPWQ